MSSEKAQGKAMGPIERNLMALANDPDGVEGLRVRLAEAQAAADFLRSALREAEEREAKLREALERIIRLPCAHPDDPDEHKKMALDLVKAQEIAHAAIGDRRGR